MFAVPSSQLSKKIVCHDGKLYGKPSAILDQPYTLATFTSAEMAMFPWDKVRKDVSFTREARHGYPEYIVRYVPLDFHLGRRFPNVHCMFMDRLEHDTVVLEFAKGRVMRTGSLVSWLSNENVRMIIALALDVPENRTKAFPWLHYTK